MGKFLIVLALLLFIFEVQPLLLSRLEPPTRFRFPRQAIEEATTTEEESKPKPETYPPVTTEPPPTTDPNDACEGCPLGEVCREVTMPCARPPRECQYLDPDNQTVIVCDDSDNNYSCKTIPMCINKEYDFWFN